jgi:hypothetical protein
MKRRLVLLFAFATAVLVLAPPSAVADPNNESATFELHMEAPNIGVAPNGDRVEVTGGGEFSVHPKSVEASGEFTHTDSEGNVLGSGTWTATDLLAFEFYGCGIIEFAGIPLEPNECGGALKLRVILTAGGNEFAGVMTVFCIVGPQAPEPHSTPPGEGVTLAIPGVINFNKTGGGENIYIRTS